MIVNFTHKIYKYIERSWIR